MQRPLLAVTAICERPISSSWETTDTREVGFTKEPFTFYLVAAFMYLGLTVVAMTAMYFLEKRAARGLTRSA